MSDDLVQKNRYKFFTIGAIGTFMATLDHSILNVALPTIADDFNAPVNIVAWVVLVYSLTLISLMLIFGALVENKGYRFGYKFGYFFFLIGSVLCATSFDIYMLIASRVVQAAGTAMFAALGPGLVTTVFPSTERGKGIGMMIMMVSGGFMIGPPLGGFILGSFSWNVIFLINVPVALFGLLWIHKYFGFLKPPEKPRSVRLAAAASISLSLLAGVFALSLVDDYPLTDPRLIGLGVLSLVCLVTFLIIELKPERAMIGLGIFKNLQFTTSLGAQLFHFCGLAGVNILIPFYLQRVRGLPPEQVGLYLVILPIMMFLVAPQSGRLSDRIGYRLLTVTGMVFIAAGMYLLSGINLETEGLYVVICLIVIGAGVGMFSTPNSSALMGSVRADQRAVASGILATNRNIGVAIGVALSTTIFSYLQDQYSGLADEGLIFIESYRPVIYLAIFFALVAAIFSLIRANRFVQPDEAEATTDKASVLPFNSS